MKKILLAGTAIVGAAILASPAQADLKLDLGGHFRGYGVFTDNDETGTGAPSNDLRDFEFQRDVEVHFSGETTTDSGLTVGVHAELDLGNESMDGFYSSLTAPNPAGLPPHSQDPNQLDEAYIYFSGGWGRVNFGSEDGAAYLLQVAAPSADSNVDGMRVYVQGMNADVWDDNTVNGSLIGGGTTGVNYVLGYDNAFFRDTDRLSYLTPKWNGFQAGLSYAPNQGQGTVNEAFLGAQPDDNVSDFEDLWEVAARWDGEFEGFGISLGVGYSTASPENAAAAGAGAFGSDDMTTWDAGATVTWNDFSLGVAYVNMDDTGASGAVDDEVETWVVGAAWDNGPYHLGASWYNTELEANAFGAAFTTGAGLGDSLEIERITVGGGYTYGPGMTFRGSVAFGEVDRSGFGPAGEPDFTQVTLGTDVNF